MRKTFLSLFWLMSLSAFAGHYEVSSPNGKVKVTVNTDETVRWAVDYDGRQVLLPSEIGIRLTQGKKTLNLGKVGKVAKISVDDSFENPFYKKLKVSDAYGQLLLYTNQKFTIEVRAYDDGAAYRLICGHTKPTLVNDETAEFRFADDYQAFVPYVNDNRSGERYCYSFESYYDEAPLSQMFRDSLAITPLAVCMPEGMKAIVMDAGVDNYPGMMLVKGEGNALRAEFAPYPLEQEIGGYDRLNLVPTKRADFIAKLNAKQTLPWRAVVITEHDADILNCDMAQRLAPACRLSDTSWIHPGKVAWDWWNNWNITGVDFPAGINTETYQYYIDFAAANGIEYVVLDEGWSEPLDIMKIKPAIDLKELCRYAASKNVDLILWAVCYVLDKDLEKACKTYAKMGVKGFKIDFMDRDDQPVTEMLYRIAETCARHNLLVDYHGMYKPAGMNRTWPNVINFEGVWGLEQMKWSKNDQVVYDVTFPFIRQLSGPVDYTQGAMRNMLQREFVPNYSNPSSQGTRARQVAEYIIFDSPLVMLCDNPTAYMKEQQTTDFITAIPTVWDETRVLQGEIGQYIVTARRSGSTWYVGGLTNWDARDLKIDLGALGLKGDHDAVLFCDGVNATRNATDYRQESLKVQTKKPLQVHLAPGGGFVLVVE